MKRQKGFEDIDHKKLKKALLKKATGYSQSEIVEEYVMDEDGVLKLSKKKVTKKFIPPDIATVKILLEQNCSELDFSNWTEEELLKEKKRLLEELSLYENQD